MLQGGWSKEYENFHRPDAFDANPSKAVGGFAGLQEGRFIFN